MVLDSADIHSVDFNDELVEDLVSIIRHCIYF